MPGHDVRAKARALSIILLLVGQEVQQIRSVRPSRISVDEYAARLKDHAARTEAQLDAFLAAFTATSTLCQWENDEFDRVVQFNDVRDHMEQLENRIKNVETHKAIHGALDDDWAATESQGIVAEAQALWPCLEKRDKLKEHDEPEGTIVDEIEEAYAKGITYAEGMNYHTVSMQAYADRSGCSLREDRNSPLTKAFYEYPTCVDDCKNASLNVNALFSQEEISTLTDCDAEQILAFGAAGWTSWCSYNHGQTCTLKGNYGTCCCQAGYLNGDPKDVEDDQGCFACHEAGGKQEAMVRTQRILQRRLPLLSEESFGSGCNYAEKYPNYGGYRIASSLRAAREKSFYRLASDSTFSLSDVKDILENEAEEMRTSLHTSMLEISKLGENGQSLVDIEAETTNPFVVLLILIAIIAAIVLIVLCSLNPACVAAMAVVAKVAFVVGFLNALSGDPRRRRR